MSVTPLEAQLIASSVIAIPAILLLLVAVLRGHFKRSEEAKWVVFTVEEEDYWDESAWPDMKKARPDHQRQPDEKGGRQ